MLLISFCTSPSGILSGVITLAVACVLQYTRNILALFKLFIKASHTVFTATSRTVLEKNPFLDPSSPFNNNDSDTFIYKCLSRYSRALCNIQQPIKQQWIKLTSVDQVMGIKNITLHANITLYVPPRHKPSPSII